MNNDHAGQVALVTGGAQGLGFGIASRLIACGARVAIWDIDEELAHASAATLGAIAEKVDVADLPSVEAALAQTQKRVGPVSILVHSAGIAGPNAALEEYDPLEWRRTIDINLLGTFHVNRAVLPSMKQRNYGRIVNVASIAGKEGNPNASAYSASKAGVIALTKSVGKETAAFNIAVNCITPAAARTRIFDQMSKEHVEYMLSKIPRGRFLEVGEVANMVGWLVSADNSFTTGAVFDLSGGRATY
ncbi:SDR family NAD(P)-dependent oxidoreductase [Mesorhizobium sp. KR9-304]|uniref:SDR family oxidoreductase n=1 Tax=Mesorhizobium sp. KR9-304 TaxID=3156614 RepID=UPI0032B435B7